MSQSSDGCQRRESGSIQIHLKLIGISQLTNPNMGCLQEPRENLYVLVVEQRSAQFTSPLITLCKGRFQGMLTSEKEKVVAEHKLCLSCLLPGHRPSKCRSKNRCKVESCDMRHHTLVHEVDLKFIGQKRNMNQKTCPKLRETQRQSPWKVKTRHHVRLWSRLRSINNQRMQVAKLVVVLWLKYFP